MAVIHDGYLLDLFRAKIRISYLPIHLNFISLWEEILFTGNHTSVLRGKENVEASESHKPR